MYRDHATALDEHDRAVGAILIGEALIEACDRAAVRSRRPETDAPQDRWRAVTEVHDMYPEVWRHLDRARRVLANRGANTAAYDELRPLARRAATRRDDSEAIDASALEDAKRAIAELKLVVPGADWAAIERRTDGLVRAPLSRRRHHRVVVASVLSLFALAVTTWFLAIVPEHRTGRSEQMRRDLHEIQLQRKLQIEAMNASLGPRCDRDLARELVRQLVLDGRVPDAAAFGARYVARCGDDTVIEHWAHAPRPHAPGT